MKLSASRKSINFKLRRHRAALVFTTALVSVTSGNAIAQSVSVSDANTVTTANNAIYDATNKPASSVSVSVKNSGSIAGNGNVVLSSLGAGRGDGALTLNNAGKLGAVNSDGIITDAVGVRLYGAGPSVSANTASVSNNGTITNGIAATNFGSDVLIANAGIVYGRMNGSGYGNVVVNTASGGTLISPDQHNAVQATAYTRTTSETKNNNTTYTTKGGNATINQDGNATLADGTTGADLAATAEQGNATVKVNAKAGAVSANGGNVSATTWSGGAAPKAGSTVNTYDAGSTASKGTAEVAVGEKGDVASVYASASGGSRVSVAGKVGPGGITSTSAAYDDRHGSSETRDSDNITKEIKNTSSYVKSGGESTVSIDQGGSVSGSVNSTGDAGSNVSVDGVVSGNVNSVSNGNNSSYIWNTKYDQNGNSTGGSSSEKHTRSGGVSKVSVGEDGIVTGSINANGDAGVSVAVNGSVGGGVTARQQNTPNTTYDVDYTTSDGPSTTKSTRTFNGGGASVELGEAATIGGNVTVYGNDSASFSSDKSSVVRGSVSVGSTPGTNYTDVKQYSGQTNAFGDYKNSSESSYIRAGGDSNFDNAGYVGGNVDIVSIGETVVNNSGQVVGSTKATAGGFESSSNGSSSKVTSVDGSKTTSTYASKSETKSSHTVGNVTGTYSGTNGQVSFDPITQGNITQSATGNSAILASGTVFGSISSSAGEGYKDNSSSYNVTNVSLTDSSDNKNNTSSYNEEYSTKSVSSDGASIVQVSGHVSDAYFGPQTVSSNATTESTVTVSGVVDGSVFSNANGVVNNEYSSKYSANYNGASGVLTSSQFASSDVTTVTGGTAVGSVTETGEIHGNLTVSGVASAEATVSKNATVLGDLSVSAAGYDSAYSYNENYDFDPKDKKSNKVEKSEYTWSAAAASGGASAVVDGSVGGNLVVDASRGDAVANVTGQVGGLIEVSSVGEAGNSVSEWIYSGNTATPVLSSYKNTEVKNNVGGKATVVVDTSADWKNKGVGSSTYSASNVEAYGVGGAAVTIASGSSVDNSVYASSKFVDESEVTETKYLSNGLVTKEYTKTETLAGSDASITNAGNVGGVVLAEGVKTASVNNSGNATVIAAFAGGLNKTYHETDNDSANLNPANRTITRTTTYTPVGGEATINNSGNTTFIGIGGTTGTINNSGSINGDVAIGMTMPNGVATATVTSTSPSLYPEPVFVPADTLLQQSYAFNQNGVLDGNVYVGGADYETATGIYQTSNIDAVINLNSGSKTTGSFFSENNTNTQVNVNGGKLYLTGPAYVPNEPANPAAAWSAGLDVGSTAGSFQLNVNSGTVEVIQPSDGPFGINGDVNVGANGTLIVGHVVNPTNIGSGASITATTPIISGADLVVSGNFVTSGSLAVGLNGTLVKTPVAPLSTSTDFLSPISTVLTGAGLAYTTPEVAGVAISTPSSITVGGNLSLGGKVQVYVPTGSIFLGGEKVNLFNVNGEVTGSLEVVSNLKSDFITLSTKPAGKVVSVEAARVSYSTAATNPNAVAAASALDKAIPGVVKVLVDDASGIRSYSTIDQLNKIQDVANIVSNLDWNLSKQQAAAVFQELASASIYGSLANLRQNVAFQGQLDRLSHRREQGDKIANLWIAPIGNFAKFGGTASGAAKVDAVSYGAAVGLDLAYNESGAFGFGFGYARHNVDAKAQPVKIDGKTYSLGAYWTQGFGPLSVNAQFVYGFSSFDATRNLELLSRKITADFNGSEWDGSIGLSYNFNQGDLNVVPYGQLALRHWSTNSFTEEGGAGLGLKVNRDSKSVFEPKVGVRVDTIASQNDTFTLRPYASADYTFQGDAGTTRTVRYLGDPAENTFTLKGVNPKGYATVSAGLNTVVADKVNVSLGGSYAFGSHNKVAAIRSIIGIQF